MMLLKQYIALNWSTFGVTHKNRKMRDHPRKVTIVLIQGSNSSSKIEIQNKV